MEAIGHKNRSVVIIGGLVMGWFEESYLMVMGGNKFEFDRFLRFCCVCICGD